MPEVRHTSVHRRLPNAVQLTLKLGAKVADHHNECLACDMNITVNNVMLAQACLA